MIQQVTCSHLLTNYISPYKIAIYFCLQSLEQISVLTEAARDDEGILDLTIPGVFYIQIVLNQCAIVCS